MTFDQDLSDNDTDIRIELETDENGKRYFDLMFNANIMDTEGHDQETYLMQVTREVLDLTIPQLIGKAVKYTPIRVIDYTPENGPEYYYKVDKKELDEAITKFLALEVSNEEIETITEIIA